MNNLRDFPFPKPDLAKPDLQKRVGDVPGMYLGKPSIIFKNPDDFVIQMKYDGIRGLLGFDSSGKYVMVSRNNNVLGSPNIKHIVDFRGSAGDKFPKGVVLDGEVYSDEVGKGKAFADFNEMGGVVRRESSYDPRAELMYFVIFDAYFPDEPDLVYSERMNRILKYHSRMTPANRKLFRVVEPVASSKLKLPRGSSVVDTLESALEYAENEGFEGIMLRNLRLPYMVGKAGNSLYKLKSFFDDEFEVVGWEEAQKKDAGTPVWICITPEGKTFKARPLGTLEARKKLWKNRHDYLGKDLTVRYQELDKDGTPRFGTGVAFRDYE